MILTCQVTVVLKAKALSTSFPNIVIGREVNCFNKEDPNQAVTKISHVGENIGKV